MQYININLISFSCGVGRVDHVVSGARYARTNHNHLYHSSARRTSDRPGYDLLLYENVVASPSILNQ